MDASESPVLILTNDMDEHADLIIEELERLDIAVVRLHTEEILTDCEVIIAESESRLHIRSSGRAVAAETIRSVWYRRPKKPKSSQQNAGRESSRNERRPMFCEHFTIGYREHGIRILTRSPRHVTRSHSSGLQNI